MPLRVIAEARAPIRVCDIGGWTDTWFAQHGAVLNVAVSPHAHARVEVVDRDPSNDVAAVVVAEDYADRYTVATPGDLGRHPLLDACISAVPPSGDETYHVRVRCEAPPGASTGTSAAVAVALLGALHGVRGDAVNATAIAREAHAVEVEGLGLQSGVQDQMSSAHGGICFITIDAYPRATVERLAVDEGVLRELDRRLVLVYLGQSHVSSHVHEAVIAELEAEGPASMRLHALRDLARDARDAVQAGDLDALGTILRQSTEAQAALHPGIVGDAARHVIGLVDRAGATGWKVNGAGGNGGSLTLLAGAEDGARARLESAVASAGEGVRVIPTSLAPTGLEVETRR